MCVKEDKKMKKDILLITFQEDGLITNLETITVTEE